MSNFKKKADGTYKYVGARSKRFKVSHLKHGTRYTDSSLSGEAVAKLINRLQPAILNIDDHERVFEYTQENPNRLFYTALVIVVLSSLALLAANHYYTGIQADAHKEVAE